MGIQAVRAKIKKLLALAGTTRNNSPEEAATAAANTQEPRGDWHTESEGLPWQETYSQSGEYAAQAASDGDYMDIVMFGKALADRRCGKDPRRIPRPGQERRAVDPLQWCCVACGQIHFGGEGTPCEH